MMAVAQLASKRAEEPVAVKLKELRFRSQKMESAIEGLKQ